MFSCCVDIRPASELLGTFHAQPRCFLETLREVISDCVGHTWQNSHHLHDLPSILVLYLAPQLICSDHSLCSIFLLLSLYRYSCPLLPCSFSVSLFQRERLVFPRSAPTCGYLPCPSEVEQLQKFFRGSIFSQLWFCLLGWLIQNIFLTEILRQILAFFLGLSMSLASQWSHCF